MARAQGVKHSEVASAGKSLADPLSTGVVETYVPSNNAALSSKKTDKPPLPPQKCNKIPQKCDRRNYVEVRPLAA